MTPQEIRQALNPEKPAKYLKRLAEDERFTQIIRVNDKRMADRELILRYLAFSNKPYTEYQPPFTHFLDDGMDALNKLNNQQLDQLERNLWKALEICQYLFEEHIFSKSILGSGRRKLNTALFEVWTVLTGPLSDGEEKSLMSNQNALIEDFKSPLNDDRFYRSIYAGTARKDAVITRFQTLESLINKYKV